MNRNVLIPSATLVPEQLQNLGKLPAIIYPINQRLVFDYLNEQYKNSCNKIIVICHKKAEKVHRRLERYCGDKLKIIDLPILEDLGRTIYYGIKNEKIPILINFADTIVIDEIHETDGDAFFYSEEYMSDIWTFFNEEGGVINDIFDKTSKNIVSGNLAKLFVGVFQIMNTSYFLSCLENAFETNAINVGTFYYALRLYSIRYPFKAIKTDNWFDIGHADTYYNSNLEVKAREFNHIVIDKARGILRKSSDNKEKFIGEIKWYLKLPEDIEYVRPRIFSYSTQYTNPFVSMEYYAYHTLHELYLYGDLSQQQWTDVFKRIRYVCDDFKRYTLSDIGIKKSLDDMYRVKTSQRFEEMRKDSNFMSFFKNEITVNGIAYKSLDEIEKILQVMVPKMLYDVEIFSIIHGDLCFANIMIDGNFSFIKLIDPRGKFGIYDIYGDFRYEMAKLFHSVDGKYDFIIKDLFLLDFDMNSISLQYSISDRKRDFDLYELFREVFADKIGEDLKKIELIEALLFLSMIPLHKESLEHQMVMLGTGLEILDRVIDIKARNIKLFLETIK